MRMKMPMGYNYSRVKNLLNEHQLHTICSSGNCPNIGECWGNGTATFMILGEICTRNCRFCSVKTGKPLPPDLQEPMRIARSVQLMELKHVVITSVDRDDLPDKGAGMWSETIRTVKAENPGLTMEVLIPDFDGQESLIDLVVKEQPDVISHNLETVRRLTPQIRSRARYDRSLDVLRYITSQGITAKSGIMLGLGETREEVLEAMDDLIESGCRIMTIGQYLAPTRDHLPVAEYVPPEVFHDLKMEGLSRGFAHVESHPLVRSSYHAEKHVSAKNNVLNEL